VAKSVPEVNATVPPVGRVGFQPSRFVKYDKSSHDCYRSVPKLKEPLMTGMLKKRHARRNRPGQAPKRRLRSKMALVRRWIAFCDWEDVRLARETLSEGGEPIPLERIIEELRIS
jgi:hypothetical protein